MRLAPSVAYCVIGISERDKDVIALCFREIGGLGTRPPDIPARPVFLPEDACKLGILAPNGPIGEPLLERVVDGLRLGLKAPDGVQQHDAVATVCVQPPVYSPSARLPAPARRNITYIS